MLTEVGNHNANTEKINKLKFIMIFGYAFIIIVAALFIASSSLK